LGAISKFLFSSALEIEKRIQTSSLFSFFGVISNFIFSSTLEIAEGIFTWSTLQQGLGFKVLSQKFSSTGFKYSQLLTI
jgi:hypothetical protein